MNSAVIHQEEIINVTVATIFVALIKSIFNIKNSTSESYRRDILTQSTQTAVGTCIARTETGSS